MNYGRCPKTQGRRRCSSRLLSSRRPHEGKHEAARARLSTRTFSEGRLEIDRFCIQLSYSPISCSSRVPLWPLLDDSTNVGQKDRSLRCAKYLGVRLQHYQSLIAVYGYGLAVPDAPARLARTQHCRYTELACDDRSVRQDPAYVGNQAACLGE